MGFFSSTRRLMQQSTDLRATYPVASQVDWFEPVDT